MADRIFPNRVQEEALDSDLVFQGIDWDNFNERLAKAKEPKKMDDETKKMLEELGDKKKPSKKDRDDLSDVPEQLREHVKKKKKHHDDEDDEDMDDEDVKDTDEDDDEDEEDEDEDDSKGPMKRKGPKEKAKKKSYAFSHPSQISAEAVEAALASGDEELANVILAVRHERRVRLAQKIERQVQAQNERNVKLAQRKAYRQNIVDNFQETKNEETKSTTDFVKVSKMNSNEKKAFAAKALESGFPAEYVEAMIGEAPKVDNLSDIKKVMSSNLDQQVKLAAVKSMTKVATLSNEDYKRLKDYWKNDLGYAEDWVDELFTQEYDKKN